MATDFISREAAEQLICETCERPGCLILCGKDCDRIDRLNAIPAADVRPVVMGKWIEECECTHPQAKCSACGESTLYAISYDIKGNAYYMNFCPNCGADMRNAGEIDQVKEGAE